MGLTVVAAARLRVFWNQNKTSTEIMVDKKKRLAALNYFEPD